MTNYYSTSDLSLASAISISGFPLDHIQKQNGKGVFHFLSSHDLTDFVEKYFTHKILVDPVRFSAAIKEAKTYLHSSP